MTPGDMHFALLVAGAVSVDTGALSGKAASIDTGALSSKEPKQETHLPDQHLCFATVL